MDEDDCVGECSSPPLHPSLLLSPPPHPTPPPPPTPPRAATEKVSSSGNSPVSLVFSPLWPGFTGFLFHLAGALRGQFLPNSFRDILLLWGRYKKIFVFVLEVVGHAFQVFLMFLFFPMLVVRSLLCPRFLQDLLQDILQECLRFLQDLLRGRPSQRTTGLTTCAGAQHAAPSTTGFLCTPNVTGSI